MADSFPLFHVVLLDAQGAEHGYVGYSFQAAGAQAAANAWNAQAERTLTAVIRDGLPPAKTSEPAKRNSYGVLVSHDSGKVALLNSVYQEAWQAEKVAADWHTETTRAVSVPIERFDDFAITLISFQTEPADFESEYAAAEKRDAAEMAEQAASNALDERGDTSDSDIELDTENATSDELGGSTFDDDDLNIKQTLFDMIDAAQLAADQGNLTLMSSLGLRYALVRYLQTVIGAIVDNKVRHTSDIGMLAKSLELFCARVIDGNEDGETCDAFSDGQSGSTVNDYGTMEALTAWIDEHAENAVAV